jgi:glycosyltransferase involved in cell wall biosynthesis
MRISFVLPYVGMAGGIRVLAIYAERLHRRGHQVEVVSLPPARRSIRSKLKSLMMGHGWSLEQPSESSHFDGLDVPHRVLERARPVVNGDLPDADVVLASFWRTGPWVAALSSAKGAKAIFLQGYETSPGQEDPAIDAVWRLPLRKIVISHWMVELARQRFGDNDVLHVPNSVDLDQFHAPSRGKQPVPTVGLLYATIHLKGVDLSLAALRRVREHYPNLRVIVFGAEPVMSGLPLPDGAEFHYRPPQQHIRDLYAACDVWLCGSRREGFHLPPLEAMACRCPVVSTRVGGPLDTVIVGVNGYLVDVDDAIGLGNRVVEVLSASEAEWRRLSDGALATACRYSWDDATDRFEAALCQVIERSPTVGNYATCAPHERTL